MSLFAYVRRSYRRILLAFSMGVVSIGAIAQTATPPTAVINTLHSLYANTDGREPYASVVQGPDGDFYGTTSQGGVNGYGSIFKVSSTGVFTLLYSFEGGQGGEGTLSGLTYGADGYFYGTSRGGNNEAGMVFKISPTGTFQALWSFTGGADGGNPESGVVEGSDGNFYGTTASGGDPFFQVGTLYKMTPDGDLTTIYTFSGLPADGGAPYAGLVEGSDGSFYGTTNNNEEFFGVGTVFKVTSGGEFTNLYYFQGNNDGGNPDGGLVEGADGNFYGSTHNYGMYVDDDDDTGQGVLYKITPTGTFTTLYEFTGTTDSGRPEGTMTLGSDGNFYGTTTNSPMGTLFQLTPAGVLTTLGSLGQPGQNAEALSGPIVGSEGDLYGTTDGGGANGSGDIFQAVLSPGLSAPVQLTLSSSSVVLGGTVTLTWQAINAYSNTSRRCIATVQGGNPAAGTWSGVQAGTLVNGIYSASATLTPTASGAYTYALTCGGSVSGFATLTVPAMALTTASLPNGQVASAYSATLAEANGLAPFTWTVSSGTLPAGLTLSPSTGVLSGTPTASGTSTFTVSVTDSESVPATTSATLSVTIATATPTLVPTVTSLTIPAGGTSATVNLALSGFASNTFNFSCSGLPAKAQCVFGAITGTQAFATSSLQITTEGTLTAEMATPVHSNRISLALLMPGILLLAGLGGMRSKVRSAKMLALMLVLMSGAMTLNGCSGGSGKKTYGTPAGTSKVIVTAVAGEQSATTTITVVVQ